MPHDQIVLRHWLILSSLTQLQQYLLKPHSNISIILIGNHKHSLPYPPNIQLILLDSKLLSSLSFRSSNIINIAYLLAIKHGAHFIYQFDSNTHPHLHHHYHGHDIQYIAFRRHRSPFINILPTFTAHFHSSSLGLPQHELINITQDGWTSIRTLLPYQETIHPFIQQHIPILPLHNNHSSLVNHPPVALEPFTFAPFTTTNILFAYEALWGLVLPQSQSHIWRSWWVQRLLWDIDGHLLFSSSSSSVHHFVNSTFSTKNEQNTKDDVKVSKLVRYLTEWRSTKTTLVERIIDLFTDMVKYEYCDRSEVKVMQDWISDLQSVGYTFPSIKRMTSRGASAPPRRRRVAVCLTGLIECIDEAWKKTSDAIRQHIAGEMDVFMYLSSTEPIVDQLPTIPQRTRLVEALRYTNFTVKVLFENIPSLDPHFPPNCTSEKSIDQPEHKVPRYYQQLFGLSNCFNMVREYEKKYNIKYDLMVRTRADIEFLRIPSTFDRSSPYDINTTLILPPNRYSSKVDDGYAVGPIDAVEVYMSRYYSFRECLTLDLHPERYLYFYLNYRKVKMIIDSNTLVGHIPHSPNRCH